MKYCENCGYLTENDQIFYCPCCDTPLVVGNQVIIRNQYNVSPMRVSSQSVLMKLLLPIVLIIIIEVAMICIVVNGDAIKEAVQATTSSGQENSSSKTQGSTTIQDPTIIQDPPEEDTSNTETYSEEMYENPEDENMQTQADTITSFDGLVVQPDIIFDEGERYLVEVVTSGNNHLRIRTGPTTDYDIIDKMPRGTVVEVFAKSSYNNSWVVVYYNGHYGWACVALNGSVYLREA